MQYQTTCALIIKGDRIERGAIVEMEPKAAKIFGDDLVVVGAEPEEIGKLTDDKPIEEMNHAELKEKAKELYLKQSGSIADLRERITLYLEGKEELTDDNN